MTRRIVWGLVILVILGVTGSIWFVNNFEQVSVKSHQNPEKEALRNPFLALEHLMKRLGHSVSRASAVSSLDSPPPNGVVFLDRSRNHLMSRDRISHLMAWVESGGHLIVVSEDMHRPDALLEHLGVVRAEATRVKGEPFPGADGYVDLPGLEQSLLLGRTGLGILQPGKTHPELQTSPIGDGYRLLRYRQGRGSITVMVDLDRLLTNKRIDDEDHAELFVTLVRQATGEALEGGGTTHAPLVFVSRLEMPGLWEWLTENAPAALASLAVLLGLWIWHGLPRFGGIVAEPPPARRELKEHLAALGRYTWRSGGLPCLIEPLREGFRARLALRHPAIATMPPHEQAAALARLTSRPEGLIANALHGEVETPHAFTQAVRTLRNLEGLL